MGSTQKTAESEHKRKQKELAAMQARDPKKDFHSHRVPCDVYRGKKRMEVSSLRLCRIIADMHQWNVNYSYRVPGVIISRQRICVFYLDQAVPIKPS